MEFAIEQDWTLRGKIHQISEWKSPWHQLFKLASKIVIEETMGKRGTFVYLEFQSQTGKLPLIGQAWLIQPGNMLDPMVYKKCGMKQIVLKL